MLNPTQVSRLCDQILILTYNRVQIGATKRQRESVDDEHRVEEPLPDHPPSSEPAHKDSPPAKRRKTTPRQASISRVPSPRPVQSRVRARQPARKGQVAAPAASQTPGGQKEVADKGSGKGQTPTPGTSEELNTKGVNGVPADGTGHPSEEQTAGMTPNIVIDNNASHDNLELRIDAGKKPPQQKASRKGEQVDMLSRCLVDQR